MPNARQLAFRDNAMAILLGASAGSTFGATRQPVRSPFGAAYGADYGADYGGFGAFGVDAPAAPASAMAILHPDHPANPNQPHNKAAMMALWMQHHQGVQKTAERRSQLYPNEGSDLKIEGYEFTLNPVIAPGSVGAGAQIALGTTNPVTATKQPTAKIKPRGIFVNAPSYGFLTISNILAGNVNVMLGGASDAGNYNNQAYNSRLTLPLLETQTPVTFNGVYSGLLPAGFPPAFSYPIVFTMQGPAEITT